MKEFIGGMVMVVLLATAIGIHHTDIPHASLIGGACLGIYAMTMWLRGRRE